MLWLVDGVDKDGDGGGDGVKLLFLSRIDDFVCFARSFVSFDE